MAAASTDKLKKYKSLYSSTLSTGIGTGTSDTITPASVAGLPTDTAVTLTIDRVNSSGVETPAKMERITGVISGGNLTSYVRGVEGTEQAHSAGAVVEMVWNAADLNNVVDWGLVEHNQDGTHKAAAVTTLKATGAVVNTGTSDTTIVTPKALADSDYEKNPMTAAGDIIYGGASGAPTRLAKGTAAQVLTMNAGATAPEWKDPATSLTKAAGSDITTGTDDAKYLTAKALADAATYKFGAAWTSYNPTPTNVTVSSGTLSGAYIQLGKLVIARIYFKYSSSTVSGLIGFSLPITAAAGQNGMYFTATILDAGTAYISGVARLGSTTRVDILAQNAGSTYVTHSDTSSSVPMAWANNDEIFTTIVYEAA